ncbi:hypothetical protein ACG83_10120 [Frankia sp. R43]|uniref:hypothetical protein n=1 Tax=Frankia sp. R43 TaxID=269536 RepID=UPI0006CA5E06|nr:hypothetical protein [Frankia sp. R43]KPM55639.1 hypothetical protein ACG83_10120 [Frankia sp. R43]
MTTSSPDQITPEEIWHLDLTDGALDYVDDVIDQGDGSVLVNSYSGPEGLREAIALGLPVRYWSQDHTRLTAEEIAVAERVAQDAGWLTELPLDRPWGWVMPPALAGEYL